MVWRVYMKRFSKQDWLANGLKTLGMVGPAGLRIQVMTETLGVTKGSFYHHFKHIRDFQEQLVAFWADQYLSTASNLPSAPRARLVLLDMLMEEAFSPVTEPENAIRVWAQQDEMARSYVEQVDAVRRGFVLNVFNSLVQDDAQAELMADMLFTITIGSMTVLPRVSPERVLELYREFKRLYGLE